MNDDVKHSGIKGMKWGVRRSRKELGKMKQGPSDDAKSAHKALVKSKISGVEALSNKELNALNQRLNLEQNYSKLSYQPSTLQKGFKAVTGILKTGQTLNDAVTFSNSEVGKKMGLDLTVKKIGTAASKKAAAAAAKS